MKRMLRQLRGAQWLLLAAVLLWTGFIWSNSMRSIPESKVQSQQVEDMIKPVLDALKIPESIRQYLVRKAAHFIEFFLLGLLWTVLFQGKRLYWPILCCLGTAMTDEGLQFFTGRGNQWSDVALDSVGAMIGIAMTALLVASLARRAGKAFQEDGI